MTAILGRSLSALVLLQTNDPALPTPLAPPTPDSRICMLRHLHHPLVLRDFTWDVRLGLGIREYPIPYARLFD